MLKQHKIAVQRIACHLMVLIIITKELFSSCLFIYKNVYKHDRNTGSRLNIVAYDAISTVAVALTNTTVVVCFSTILPTYVMYTSSLVAASGVTWTLKHLIHKERPDHSDNHSFPSGHATLIAVGLFFVLCFKKIHTKSVKFYILFLTLLALIGCACRVFAMRHHILDVIIGFLIGFLVSYTHYLYSKKIFRQHPHIA